MSKPAPPQGKQIEAGKARLVKLAKGLPVSPDELFEFFRDDLADFGTPGAVQDQGIKQAAEWFVMRYLEPRKEYPKEIPVGMVQCPACTQSRCKWNVGYTRQSSPAWRWCADYTGRTGRAGHEETDRTETNHGTPNDGSLQDAVWAHRQTATKTGGATNRNAPTCKIEKKAG